MTKKLLKLTLFFVFIKLLLAIYFFAILGHISNDFFTHKYDMNKKGQYLSLSNNNTLYIMKRKGLRECGKIDFLSFYYCLHFEQQSYRIIRNVCKYA